MVSGTLLPSVTYRPQTADLRPQTSDLRLELKKVENRGKRKRPRDDGTTAFGLDDGRNDKRKEGDFLLLSEAVFPLPSGLRKAILLSRRPSSAIAERSSIVSLLRRLMSEVWCLKMSAKG